MESIATRTKYTQKPPIIRLLIDAQIGLVQGRISASRLNPSFDLCRADSQLSMFEGSKGVIYHFYRLPRRLDDSDCSGYLENEKRCITATELPNLEHVHPSLRLGQKAAAPRYLASLVARCR